MARVYLALQRAVAGFEKLVVIKVIRPELARDPAFVELLLAEARTAATLNHPNVVQTFDVGEAEGTYYIAM
ncbi:MAG: serine/threonine protein kinase, partial [Myxococcota bacterium]